MPHRAVRHHQPDVQADAARLRSRRAGRRDRSGPPPSGLTSTVVMPCASTGRPCLQSGGGQARAGVGMDVDEAGRDEAARGVDAPWSAVAAPRSPTARMRSPMTPTSARRGGSAPAVQHLAATHAGRRTVPALGAGRPGDDDAATAESAGHGGTALASRAIGADPDLVCRSDEPDRRHLAYPVGRAYRRDECAPAADRSR